MTIATLQMLGEGRFNAVTLASANAEIDRVLADDSVSALILRGEGKNFSQGLDLDAILSQPETSMQVISDCMRFIGRLLSLPVPVLAAVNGHAFGLGAMLVMAADYAVMREDRGYICLPEVDMGAPLTARMHALVGAKLSTRALRDMLLTGERLTAQRALELAVIDGVAAADDVETSLLAIAQPMMGKLRQGLGALKRGLNAPVLAVIEAEEDDTPSDFA